jgi:hypothetical protein
MGTSVNQSSPRTLNWSAAQSGYRNANVPVERVAAEIWRAAGNQPSGNLADLLARPIVATIGELASQAKSGAELAKKSAFVVAESKQASLAADIARRAAVQSVGATNPFKTYSERLFSEATSYLVARDLPGYVGMGRIANVAQSVRFAAQVAQHVAEVARSIDVPTQISARSWAAHVRSVVDSLRRSGR